MTQDEIFHHICFEVDDVFCAAVLGCVSITGYFLFLFYYHLIATVSTPNK